MAGSRKIVEAGGTVISQDEKLSVVWGMPAAVAEGGLRSKVDKPDALLAYIFKFCSQK